MLLTFLPNLSLAATSAITFALVALVVISGTRRKQNKRQRRLDRNERLQSI